MAGIGSVADAGGRDFARAHAALRADPAIQFDLPAYKLPVTPEWVRSFARFLHGLEPALRWIGWIGIALLVLLIVALLVRRFWGVDLLAWRRRPTDAGEAEPVHDTAPARALLAEADALAAAGAYPQAVHLLLLRGIEEIARRRPALLAPALTSRDIARAPALPAPARETFAGIAAIVERSLFGGRAVDAAGWARARSAYEDFALAGSWR